jgi:hypothetical protein
MTRQRGMAMGQVRETGTIGFPLPQGEGESW